MRFEKLPHWQVLTGGARAARPQFKATHSRSFSEIFSVFCATVVQTCYFGCGSDQKMETTIKHLTMDELEAALDHLRETPKDEGVVELIVRRPQTDEREVLEVAELDPLFGLIGDNWISRGSRRTPDGSPHPEMQINIMNSRVAALVAQEKERWSLAGDQLYIDMELSKENLPAGTRLAIGSAVVEVSPLPHTGCHKFVARFGQDAMKFVNSELGKELCLRGINAKVVQAGAVRLGATAKKV
jgi:hypothetical protein